MDATITTKRLVNAALAAMMAGLLAPSAVGANPRGGSALARIEILGESLARYRRDVGRFPSSEEGLAALREQPEGATGWRGRYLERDIPLDPWGRPYVYVSPARYGSGEFDLYSMGADGDDDRGATDDITNWSGMPPGVYSMQCERPLPFWPAGAIFVAVLNGIIIGLVLGLRYLWRRVTSRSAAQA